MVEFGTNRASNTSCNTISCGTNRASVSKITSTNTEFKYCILLDMDLLLMKIGPLHIVRYLHSFRALFVLHEAQLDNNTVLYC